MFHMKKVKVYSTPTCPHCLAVKAFLKEKGVEFQDVDVSVSRESADEMIKKTGQMGVPVVDIDGKIVVGFDREKIESLL